MSQVIKKVVLAYSGGLDTSVILKWLQETYDAEVIAFCADLGQGEDLQAIKAKAKALGVKKVYVEDLQETFVTDYVFPMLRGNAMYEGCYLLGTSIARPLIARRQAEIALKEGAQAVSHGATGKGNDQVRFELTYMALAPDLKIIAPWKDPTFELRDRESAVEYANKKGVPIPVSSVVAPVDNVPMLLSSVDAPELAVEIPELKLSAPVDICPAPTATAVMSELVLDKSLAADWTESDPELTWPAIVVA